MRPFRLWLDCENESLEAASRPNWLYAVQFFQSAERMMYAQRAMPLTLYCLLV